MFLNNKRDINDGTATDHVNDIFAAPQKAILKLSVPIIIAMVFGAANNIIDLIWVSGLGVDALSAVGFSIPINMIVLALSGGLGAGAGALISQKIGANDKADAGLYAVHGIFLTILSAVLFSILIMFFIKPLLLIIGAGDLIDMALSYARILFSGVIIFFFNDMSASILKSEGNVKRITQVIFLCVVLNIILDPIFIYLLNLGVKGAAIASLLSGFLGNVIFFNWLLIHKKTYITLTFKNFRIHKEKITHILTLSLPLSIAGLSFSFLTFIMNIIVTGIGGTDGVAVFATGMRIVFISLLPMMGITSAVTTLVGVAYGGRNFIKIKQIKFEGIKLGLIIEGSIAVATFFLAPYITQLFIWGPESTRIENDLVLFLRIMAFVYISAPFARSSIGAFIGTGKSQYAMTVALMRALIVIPPVAYLCGNHLEMGLSGVWVGLVAGNWIVSMFTFGWAIYYMNRLEKPDYRIV